MSARLGERECGGKECVVLKGWGGKEDEGRVDREKGGGLYTAESD